MSKTWGSLSSHPTVEIKTPPVAPVSTVEPIQNSGHPLNSTPLHCWHSWAAPRNRSLWVVRILPKQQTLWKRSFLLAAWRGPPNYWGNPLTALDIAITGSLIRFLSQLLASGFRCHSIDPSAPQGSTTSARGLFNVIHKFCQPWTQIPLYIKTSLISRC